MDRKAKAETNGLAVASLVFGILGVLTSWTLVLGISNACLAFMFSLLSRGNKKKCGLATAGTILGIVALILGAIVAVAFVSMMVRYISQFLYNYRDLIEQLNNYLQQFGIGMGGVL